LFSFVRELATSLQVNIKPRNSMYSHL